MERRGRGVYSHSPGYYDIGKEALLVTLSKKWFAGICAVGISLGTLWNSALAATDGNAVFLAHYEHNGALEASLLYALDSSNSGFSNATDFSSLVDSLNGKSVQPLYATEQGLAAALSGTAGAAANLPIKAVLQNRQDILANINIVQQDLTSSQGSTGDDTKMVNWLANNPSARKLVQGDLNVLEKSLTNLPFVPGRKSVSTAQELAAVQRTFGFMQRTVVDLTSAWLEMTGTAPLHGSIDNTGASGFAYDFSIISSIPDHGIKDFVVQLPNLMAPDIGVYKLKGPAGYEGVTIDSLTGTLNFAASATSGTYSVIYTANNAEITTSVVVS